MPPSNTPQVVVYGSDMAHSLDVLRRLQAKGESLLTIDDLATRVEQEMLKSLGLLAVRRLEQQFSENIGDQRLEALAVLLTAQDMQEWELALIWLRGTFLGSFTLPALLMSLLPQWSS